MELTPRQLEAVALLKTGRIGVITGGPGTGKTTVLKAVANVSDIWSVFAAPTGKAAKRIAEVTGVTASTIHRMLGSLIDTPGTHKLAFNRIIVDEASMVDVELASALLCAVADGAAVFFVGDVDQLPSVGPGNFFEDLIASGTVPVVRLDTVHRAAKDSWVCANAPRILFGDIDVAPADDFEYVQVHDSASMHSAVLEHILPLYRSKAVAQLLIPQKGGPMGTAMLNSKIQGRLFPRRRDVWKVGHQEIGVGDSVIHTKNNYTLEVFNGETGVVHELSRSTMTVDFEDRLVMYSIREAQDLMLSYALTIHKAQGSEWDTIVVVCHSTHSYMLNQRLLYTAVTRAKKRVVLIGDDMGLEHALSKESLEKRNTALKEMLTCK